MVCHYSKGLFKKVVQLQKVLKPSRIISTKDSLHLMLALSLEELLC